jgi:hypothetical protein
MKRYSKILVALFLISFNGLIGQELLNLDELISDYESKNASDKKQETGEFSSLREGKGELPCEDCIRSFSPSPGKYIVSGWVKEQDTPITTTSYVNSSLKIGFISDATEFVFMPSGQIIDGWQRIEGVITIPSGATAIQIILKAETGSRAYFDDIRFFPLDGSMMSYVYDPESLRLMAELDERNYATFYEYDEEGKLVRVKKETERGIMTIQENRDNIKKL